jgi:eukaryotic-like serine/threonine-protein kinase
MGEADGVEKINNAQTIKSDLPATSDPAPTLNTAAAAAFTAEHIPEIKSIGPYQIIRRLGEGGMGQVWLAQQREPIHRQVALKLIRVGRYDESVLQRFYAERQSLAIMDHPSIAKVFDAGATPDGQPYFVMEYVPGQPLTTYCDRHQLTIRDRLDLFVKVCEGVQHAHQKAVMHRDLKPANILVVEVDGKPVPRIIDFGIAKAASPTLDGTFLTHAGGWVGTPGYMSPEQADPGVIDVDTRTDVYSLGAVLYELLTSFVPFDTRDWRKQDFDEYIRHLREEDPPRPSTKVSTGKGSSKSSAEARAVEPNQLASLLHGDLDWITMKALEKDRTRRYGTPMELAADIGRYLNDEPIIARPASSAYRLRKYARRHRVGVAIVAGLVLLLTGFAAMQAAQVRRVTRERDRANRIADFMKAIFKVSNPSEARGNAVTAREILDRATQQINSNLSKDPELQAELIGTMSQTYTGLGLYSRAQDLTERALADEKSLYGERNRKTLETESFLGALLRAGNHLPEAEKLLQSTIDAQRQVVGPNDPDTLASMDRLAYVYTNEARHSEAEGLLRQTLDAERRVLGPDDPQTLGTLNELAEILTPQGRYAEADKIYSELMAAQRRTLGPDHPATLLSMSHAAENLEEEGHFADAEKMYSAVIEAQRRVLGPEHPQTLRAMTMLSLTLAKEGHYAEADKLQEQVIVAKTRVLGPTHASTLQSMEMEALGLNREGRYAEADKMFRDVIETAEKTNQPATVAEAWYNSACAKAARGKPDEAFADLGHAIKDGLISPGELSADPELKSIHDDPRFAAVVAQDKEIVQSKTAASNSKKAN